MEGGATHPEPKFWPMRAPHPAAPLHMGGDVGLRVLNRARAARRAAQGPIPQKGCKPYCESGSRSSMRHASVWGHSCTPAYLQFCNQHSVMRNQQLAGEGPEGQTPAWPGRRRSERLPRLCRGSTVGLCSGACLRKRAATGAAGAQLARRTRIGPYRDGDQRPARLDCRNRAAREGDEGAEGLMEIGLARWRLCGDCRMRRILAILKSAWPCVCACACAMRQRQGVSYDARFAREWQKCMRRPAGP